MVDVATNTRAQPVYLVDPATGMPFMIDIMVKPAELDTAGNTVPVWYGHTFSYDSSGNLVSDTVSDGTNSWTRSYTYSSGNMASDSGWVKQ